MRSGSARNNAVRLVLHVSTSGCGCLEFRYGIEACTSVSRSEAAT